MAAAPRKMLTIPLVAGLQTKGDRRAQEAPALDIATDVEFDDVGGLRLRFPFQAMSNAILGGGTLTGARRLAVSDGELLCFTADTLYSWSEQLAVWVSRGTHLAVSVDERTVMQTTGDQFECDRAELTGTIVYAWQEPQNGISNTLIFVGAADSVTGSVTVPPTAIGTVGGSSPRLIALATKILLIYNQGSALKVLAIDPANVATSLAATPTGLTGGGEQADATRLIGADSAVVASANPGGAGYTIFTITAGLTIASASKSRACGTVGVSCTPDGLHVQIVRASSSSAITGDLILLSSLADVFINQAIGTVAVAPLQIACAHRSVKTGGQYRCYVWWSLTNGSNNITSTNWVDDGGSIGTAVAWVNPSYVASRAFDYNGRVYVWSVFAESNETSWSSFGGSLQNTFFLFRDDAFLVAKACAGNAAGFPGAPQNSSCLPGVQLIAGSTSFAWMGNSRRIIDLNGVAGYAQRAPREITFAFDDNAARRCTRIGSTLYVSGGLILQYDGVQLTEVGFQIMPWAFVAGPLGSGGHLSAGGYALKGTYRWDNAAGELDRSSTTNVAQITCVANDTIEYLGIASCPVTRKLAPLIAVEAWRTIVNPAPGAPFYLETSKNPAQVTNPNRYLTNAGGILSDILSDASIEQNEVNPENGAVLPNICPPAAAVLFGTDTRAFLGGIAGLPNTVQYSQLRVDGQVLAFNDALTFDVPAPGGAITAIADLDGTRIVFRENATYAFSGDGFDNTGGGANYALARILSTDLGCASQEAVVLYDDGLLVKTNKGWFLLDRGLNYTYVGAGPKAFDGEAVLATEVLSSRHQVRIQTTARTLLFDTLVKQWATWSVVGIDAALWNGQHVILTPTGPLLEQSTYAAVNYGFDVETSWIKPNDQQGRIIVDYFGLLGEYRSAFSLRFRMASDYIGDGAGGWQYHTDSFWDPFPAVVGSSLQVRPGPAAGYSRCEAFKIRLTAYAPDHVSAPTGPCARLTSIALQYADEPGLFTGLNQAQKV